MKRFIFYVAAAFLLSGCVKNPTPSVDPDEDFKEVIENMTTTEVFSVPVQEGYTTFVTYKGQILAVTSKAMDILVPKGALGTKSDADLTVYYKLGTVDVSTSSLWQTIAFEDSKEGDFDYNDLIVHANYEITGNSLVVGVHPIAFGATKDIKLGFEWHQGASSGTKIVAEDCRQELFGGAAGFINTTGYDVHYDDFATSVSVTLPNSTDAVIIDWFIVVDGNTYIYAVNQSGYDCIDGKGMPYGFAITDAGNGAATGSNPAPASNASTKATTYASWDAVMAQWSWPTAPVPADYENLPPYPNNSNHTGNYYIKQGETWTGGLKKDGSKFYVKGEMTLTNDWGNPADIYVLDGGVLNISKNGSILQNINIYNFGGSVNFPNNDGKANFGSGSVFMTTGNIEVDDLIVQGGARVFIGEGAYVKKLDIKNSSSQFYLGCCIYATESIYLTNSSEMFVKHYINTPYMKLDSQATLYLNGDEDGGCLVDITDLYTSANRTATVSCIGNDYAVFNINHYLLDSYQHGDNEPFDISDRFLGKVDVHYQMANNKDSWDAPNTAIQLKVSQDVILNGSTSLPANGCHPAFGVPGGAGGGTATGDTGLCWWKFPMERVNIDTCYDFGSWRTTGEFDFTLLSGAKVFDIAETKEGKKIYEMAGE